MALTSGSKTLPGTSVRQRDGPLCLYPYLDKKYIAALRKSIEPDRATPSQQIHAGAAATDDGSDTTHFAVVDAEGNAVAVTLTLNSHFGSGVTECDSAG